MPAKAGFEVADEAGPRLPERSSSAEGEGPIGLREFYDEFMRRERGVANVVAAVEDNTAEMRLNELISSIENDRHFLNPSQPTR